MDIYTEALTHPSVSRRNYQRLELLGDRVLNMVVMEMLYREYPNENEGQLSLRLAHLTSGATCARVGRSLRLHSKIVAPHAIATSDNAIADVVEATIGAIYLDKGFDAARAFIVKHWKALLPEGLVKDSKTSLQEFTQANKLARPIYYLKDKEGPDHACTFTVEVVVGMSIATGSGSSKKEAEHRAASKLLDILDR